jgi:hypothetical protein
MSDPVCSVPIAFIVFNRPDVTRQVFAEIAKQRPKQLLIISDGARVGREGEAAKVRETRAITEAIDWPCEVHRNYADQNMGCKKRVASGIGWVFTLVERAIILEDDCLPSPGFFKFCEDMLTLYADDRRVYSISGSYFGDEDGEAGHYFSQYALMWGWATWRDRWARYQLAPTDYPEILWRTWWRRPVSLAYWRHIYAEVMAGTLDTWDVQWILTLWRNRALACRPSHNLVRNLGFGADATHTLAADSPLGRLQVPDAPLDLGKRLTDFEPNGARDRIDERRWALINLRSVLLMYFPWIGRLKASLR